MYFDIRGLPLEPPQWLMNHDPRVCQAKALALCARGKQQRPHTGSLSDAKGADIRLDILHCVINRQSSRNQASWRIDIKVYVLVCIFRLKKQELRHDQVG